MLAVLPCADSLRFLIVSVSVPAVLSCLAYVCDFASAMGMGIVSTGGGHARDSCFRVQENSLPYRYYHC